MNSMKIAILLLSTSFVACQSSQNSQHKSDSVASIESGPGKIVDSRFLIVPGRSVGDISLGENVEIVGKMLGKPDVSDAAMGKAWGIWYRTDSSSKQKEEIAIYSAYRDTSMRVKSVKQIRITSAEYKTQDGYRIGMAESETKQKFPGMEKVSAYLNEQKDTVTVFDSKQEGVGIEFLSGKSVALTVHPANQPINATYLTLHPKWKAL